MKPSPLMSYASNARLRALCCSFSLIASPWSCSTMPSLTCMPFFSPFALCIEELLSLSRCLHLGAEIVDPNNRSLSPLSLARLSSSDGVGPVSCPSEDWNLLTPPFLGRRVSVSEGGAGCCCRDHSRERGAEDPNCMPLSASVARVDGVKWLSSD